MALMEKLDDFLIDKGFQPFSEWFHTETGHNQYWLARMGVRFEFCTYIGFVILISYSMMMSRAYLLLPLPLLLFLTRAYRMKSQLEAIRNIEAFQLAHPLCMNPFRLFMVGGYMRMSGIVVLLLVGSFALWLHLDPAMTMLAGSIIGFLLEQYFMACIQKPRKPKEVKEEVPMGALPQGA